MGQGLRESSGVASRVYHAEIDQHLAMGGEGFSPVGCVRKNGPIPEPYSSVFPRFCQEPVLNSVGLLVVSRLELVDIP